MDVQAPTPTPSGSHRPWRSYVAIGDSFTEGLADVDATRPGGHRGWADRLAEDLDTEVRAAGGEGLAYANLAVRGRLLGAILTEQLPVALAAGADLVSLSGGGNDLLRPGADVDALAAAIDGAVGSLRAAGSDVLLTAGFDPGGLPLVRFTRGRVAAFNLLLWSIARRHGAVVLDLWTMRTLYDRRMWAPDRIHLSPEGHRRVALLGAATLRGTSSAQVAAWAEPLPPVPSPSRRTALLADARWAGGHLAPWVHRRLTHRSSGDAVVAKRAALAPVWPDEATAPS